MNWFSYVALLATLLPGLIDCQSAAVAIEGYQTASSHRLVNAVVHPVAAAEDNETGGEASTPLSDDDEEKLTIKTIMQQAHKSGLLKKVATGKASDAEIAKLHKFYSAMPELAPPQGEEKSWQEKTATLIKASKAAVDKDPAAGALLKSATNCAACHQVHKPNDND